MKTKIAFITLAIINIITLVLILISSLNVKTNCTIYCNHNNGTFCEETYHISEMDLSKLNVLSIETINLSRTSTDIHYHYVVVWR